MLCLTDCVRCVCCQFCQKVWLGLHDGRPPLGHDTRDNTHMRDVMAQRYEKKRWYVQPTDAMCEEARRLNTPSPQTSATSRPSAVARSQPAGFDVQVILTVFNAAWNVAIDRYHHCYH